MPTPMPLVFCLCLIDLFSVFNRKRFVQLFVNKSVLTVRTNLIKVDFFFVVYCILLHDVTTNTYDIYKQLGVM